MIANRVQVALDGRPVPAYVGPGRREPVLDRPSHKRLERRRWGARGGEEVGGGRMERHQEACGHRRTGVVERSMLVREGERFEPE